MKVKVNNEYNFDIDLDKDVFLVDQQPIQIDFLSLSAGRSHFIYENRSYSLELVAENRLEKTAIIKVNGSEYEIKMEDRYDQLLKQLGMDNLKANKVSEIKAPMPGLVLNIMVEVWQHVQQGDSLLILEAMKMENVIKSPSAGVVANVLIEKGNKVEKNELLIKFD